MIDRSQMIRWTTTAMFAISVSTLATVPLWAQQTPGELPPGPGLELIQRSCVGCHDIYMITTKHKSREDWATTIEMMAARGAEVTPEEMQIIEEYLSQNFSKDAAGSVASQ
jgi:hypothetical protein